MRRIASLASFACCLVAIAAPVFAAMVYDNTASYTNLEHELLSAGQTNSEEHGNQITLGGIERVAEELRFVLRIHGTGVAGFDYRLRFYENDGPDGAPGTLFYESPVTRRVVDSGAPLTYTQPLPNVLVPETFTWTLQLTDRTGNMARFGPSEFNPPTVGSAPFGYWRRIGASESWEFIGLTEAPFGARLSAESDPVGVEEAALQPLSMRVWPNPATERVSIELIGGSRAPLPSTEPLRVLDSSGRIVHQQRVDQFPLQWTPDATLPAGTYFVSYGDDNSTRGRVVIIR